MCGLHGRGKDHLSAYSHLSGVEIAALCDVDENVLRKHVGQVSGNPQAYVDVRKLLEDKSIDVISIATPNHWHTLIAIWACQAAKDVYVEKPCSHNLWEGGQLVRAVQKYNRIVQHGTQIRSASAIQKAIQGLHHGAIGDVYLARGAVLQMARHDWTCARRTRSRRCSLRLVDRARAPKAFHAESVPL